MFYRWQTSTRAHVRMFSRSLCTREAQRTSASATIARTSCFINVPHTTPKLKNNNFSYLSIKSNLRSATDMDDQDLSVLDSRLPFEQYADRYSPQIYSLERYIGPSICRQQASPKFPRYFCRFYQGTPDFRPRARFQGRCR